MPCQETRGQRLNNHGVRRFAQAIQKEDYQGNHVGRLPVVKLGPHVPEVTGRCLDCRIRRRHITFEKGQPDQRRGASVVGWPASVPTLHFLEAGDATLDGLPGCFILGPCLGREHAGAK